MILLINICKEKLHYLEFVKPIEDILNDNKLKYFVRDYKNVREGDLKNAKKIIICGTSLMDEDFVKDINYFRWISEFNGSILGICGGMQIIGMVFDIDLQIKKLNIKNSFKHILKKKKEIGYYFENFKEDFLGLKGMQEVFHLHNNYVNFGNEFKRFTDSKIPQAIKHKTKNIYGVLFHPEVRQKELISRFCSFGVNL